MFNALKKRFATRSLQKNFITTSQIIEALTIQLKEDIQHKPHRPIGQIFFDLGYMNKDQIDDILQSSVEPRFGDIAVSKGFITVEHLVEAMTQQIKEDAAGQNHRLIGEILADLGYMNKDQVRRTLDILKGQ